jgi:hypothetical protein
LGKIPAPVKGGEPEGGFVVAIGYGWKEEVGCMIFTKNRKDG